MIWFFESQFAKETQCVLSKVNTSNVSHFVAMESQWSQGNDKK
jgi:hypothetical protein